MRRGWRLVCAEMGSALARVTCQGPGRGFSAGSGGECKDGSRGAAIDKLLWWKWSGFSELRGVRLRMIAHERWIYHLEPGNDDFPGAFCRSGGSPDRREDAGANSRTVSRAGRGRAEAGGAVAAQRAGTDSGEACGSGVAGPGEAMPEGRLLCMDRTGESASQAGVWFVFPVYGVVDRRRGSDPGSFFEGVRKPGGVRPGAR